jgi:tetratricopeptide (TPR) repeat protein
LKSLLVAGLLSFLCTSGYCAFAANYVPEMDDPTFDLSPLIRDPNYKFAEEEKRRVIRNYFNDRAIASCVKGDYGKALELFQRLDKIIPYEQPTELAIARCLNKLGQNKDALLLADHVLEREHGRDYDAYRLKIEIQCALGEYDAALKTCHKYQLQQVYGVDSAIQESNVFFRMGDKARAIKKAEDTYFHCVRNGFRQDETDIVRAKLKELGVNIPDSIPEIKIDNDKVMESIVKVAEMRRPPTLNELESIYKLPLYSMTHPNTTDLISTHIRRPEYANCVVDFDDNLPKGPSVCFLRVDINNDRSSISKEDVEKAVGPLEADKNHYENETNWHLKDAKTDLSFVFLNATGMLHQYRVRVPAQRRVKAPKLEVTPTLEEVRRDIDQGRFRVAAKMLLRHFNEYVLVDGWQQPGTYENYLAVKKLFADAYRGLELDDIARYVERAPYFFLRRDVCNTYATYKDLPTSAEYAAKHWTVQGGTTDPKSGIYLLHVDGYGTIPFYSDSRNFKDMYALIPGIIRGAPKEVPVIPCEWIDAVTFNL